MPYFPETTVSKSKLHQWPEISNLFGQVPEIKKFF
jgi:hypothetical protein